MAGDEIQSADLRIKTVSRCEGHRDDIPAEHGHPGSLTPLRLCQVGLHSLKALVPKKTHGMHQIQQTLFASGHVSAQRIALIKYDLRQLKRLCRRYTHMQLHGRQLLGLLFLHSMLLCST